MVRVLMCGPVTSSGGVSTHTKYITKYLSKLGVNVIFYNFTPQKKDLFKSNFFTKIYRRTIGLLYTSIIYKKKYDILHTQTSGGFASFISALAGAISVKLTGKALVVTFHNSSNIKRLVTKYSFLFGFVLKNADIMILVSNKQKNILLESFPVYSSKLVVVPNGYDPLQFYPQNMKKCREILNLPTDVKIILTIGNLFEIKGHKYLVDSIDQVIHKRNDVLCMIVGGGPLKNNLENQINSLELQDHVKLVGLKAHAEIPLWINACDLFVLPSLNEGNPTVMFESLGCGKPFIGTDVGGIPEIITSNEYGLLCEIKNSAKLAENILKALERNWNSFHIVEYSKQFRWDTIAKKTEIVYQKN